MTVDHGLERGFRGEGRGRRTRPRIGAHSRLPLGRKSAVVGLVVGMALSVLGCADSIPGYVVWVSGAQPGGLIVSVAAPPGAPGGPVTAFYLVPTGELRQSTVKLESFDDQGTIRVYDHECRLLDQAAIGSGLFKVEVSATGAMTVTPYGTWLNGPPVDAPPLEPSPTSCDAEP